MSFGSRSLRSLTAPHQRTGFLGASKGNATASTAAVVGAIGRSRSRKPITDIGTSSPWGSVSTTNTNTSLWWQKRGGSSRLLHSWTCRGCRQISTSLGPQMKTTRRVPAVSASRFSSTDSGKEKATAPLSGVEKATKSSAVSSSTTAATTPSSATAFSTSSISSSLPSSSGLSPKSASTESDELPSHEEERRSRIAKRFSSLMDNLQANIFFAGQRLNDLTGYSGIEALKREIETQERALRAAQETLTTSKAAYAAAITQRSESQREVNELLQRKNLWSSTDLERFTELYRSDHANELAESGTRERLAEAERAADEASARLSSKILGRYHEEQIWSDKIRRMSTWGTWGLMGVNVLLFLVFQIGVEPWRRKRLVRGFEEKVREALEDSSRNHLVATGEALTALQASQGTGVSLAESKPAEADLSVVTQVEQIVAEEVAVEADVPSESLLINPEPGPWSERGQAGGLKSWIPGLGVYRTKLEELFSQQAVTVRQVDLTQKALEGVFAGVMITSVIATMVARGR